MRIVILGYGIEGKSAWRFLKRRYPNVQIEIRDVTRQGKLYLDGLEKFDLIVRSPGVRYLTHGIQRAKKRGVEITSATKMFFNELEERALTSPPNPLSFVRRGGKKIEQYISPPYEGGARGGLKTGGEVITIGITGTKGKGTTAMMLYQILKVAKKDVFLVGNIGHPALDILPKLKKNSIVIFELSSFQLQDLDHSPHIAVVLEIVPDHLDHHKFMKEYVDAKANIARYQRSGDIIFYTKENKYSRAIAQKSKGKSIPLTWRPGRQVRLRVPGEHNMRNAAVAIAVARAFGVDDVAIKKSLERFRGLPYHTELVREVRGVKFYNDSASTNPISTKVAIETIREPKILIMGGVDKGFDYGILRAPIIKHDVRRVLLYGANKKKIRDQLLNARNKLNLKDSSFYNEKKLTKYLKDLPADRQAKAVITMCSNLQSALKRAFMIANAGDAILFSPASASFDMFKNSKDRGRAFSRLVQSLHS